MIVCTLSKSVGWAIKYISYSYLYIVENYIADYFTVLADENICNHSELAI